MRDHRFTHNGIEYSPSDFSDSWEIEITADDAPEPILVREEVYPKQSFQMEVLKTHMGEFFLVWMERHPERCCIEEAFPRYGHLDPDQKAVQEFLRADKAIAELLPDRGYFAKITRRGAFELYARYVLPEEFYADAGI